LREERSYIFTVRCRNCMLIFTGRCWKVGSNSKRREIIPGCSSSRGDAGRLDRIARGERSYLDAHLHGEMQAWTSWIE
jgi:hypothetical protein